jgi:hypothetical protein
VTTFAAQLVHPAVGLSIKQLQLGREKTFSPHGCRRNSDSRRARIVSSAYLTRAAVAVLLLLRALASPAQDVTEPALKAAFIYNFGTFTDWPDDTSPDSGPSVFCVLGDAGVADALERTVKGRQRAGRSITVSRVTLDGPIPACHILYLSHVPAAQVAQIVIGLRDTPVLTISDMDGFGELGGIAQFFFQDGNLRFNVRVEPAKHARLQISSRLLALSKRP